MRSLHWTDIRFRPLCPKAQLIMHFSIIQGPCSIYIGEKNPYQPTIFYCTQDDHLPKFCTGFTSKTNKLLYRVSQK